MSPEFRLLPDVFAHWAEHTPDAEALSYRERRWTWAQFHGRIRRLTGALAALGVGAGDRVAFVDKNHPACLELTYAASALGAATAIPNWRSAAPELAYMLNDCGAKILVVGEELRDVVDSIAGQLSTVERLVTVRPDGDDEYEELLGAGAPTGLSDVEQVSEDAGALIMYTSGTTGHPKGAVLTHRSLLTHTRNVSPAFPLTGEDRNLLAMPLFHVGGSSYALLGFASGQPTTMTREPDAASLFGALAQGATHAFLVPAVVAGIVGAGEQAMAAMSRLKHLGYGASPMPLPLLRTALAAWPEMDFVQVYGMTEVAGVVSTLDPAAHRDTTRPERLASAGTMLAGNELRVVDPVTGEDVAPGEAGELWFRTGQRMSGYFGKPEATAETIVEGDWLRSGDVGWVDDGGFVFISDRVKDMIITGGENVYSPEVERVVAEFPGVAEVAVIGVPDERWGESVKAVVAPHAGQEIDTEKLIAFCREQLAGFKCPRTVDVLDALPRNATGKILKRDLRAAHWAGRDRQV